MGSTEQQGYTTRGDTHQPVNLTVSPTGTQPSIRPTRRCTYLILWDNLTVWPNLDGIDQVHHGTQRASTGPYTQCFRYRMLPFGQKQPEVHRRQ